jgi:1-deoxy-D-xylulose-5-phosphate reductoisomerase
MSKQRVLILGSTGSIGQNSLAVLDALQESFEVVGLAAGCRWELLSEQCDRWKPGSVAISDASAADEFRQHHKGSLRVLSGVNALYEIVESVEFDCVIVAVVGAAALPATALSVQRGARVAIANKESFVIAGPMIAALARESGAEILPIDSEHSAVFQALHAGRACDVRRVVLTASGGPFRTWSTEQMEHATLNDALNHPVWNMGPKVTIDSATMMNKSLEIVEARWLFDIHESQIEVLVHPESIIHSLVEFLDGSMVAQLGTPDMRTPIQYALTYPARLPCPSPRLDLSEMRRLNFQTPDYDRFPALRLGHAVAKAGGTSGAVLNAANEAAVELFRSGAIGFLDIAGAVETVLERHDLKIDPTLEDLLIADTWARNEVKRCATC